MFSAPNLLLDVLLGLVIARLFYLAAKRTIEHLLDSFQSRLQARLSSRSSLSHSHFLSLTASFWPSGTALVPASEWNGGGVGGTNVPDHQNRAASSNYFVPFSERHRGQDHEIGHHSRRASAATRRVGERGTTAVLSSSSRRDWIAVTDPARSIEVPVYPELVSLIKALTFELRESACGALTIKMLNNFISIMGTKTARSGLDPVEQVSGAQMLHLLPPELVAHILLLAACPSLSPHEPRSNPISILSLSKQHYALIIPRLYHSVSLHTPSAFRTFRCTMALHNPALGKFVKRLQIGSSEFDGAGYCPVPLADHGPLAVGIEQMLLASPNLKELSLDLFSMSALHTGTISRLEKGPQPKRLCTELTTIPYLSLPTFEDLDELELLVFGMDPFTAQELRVTLPLLSKLTLRLVTRRRGMAFRDGRDTWLPTELGTLDDDDDDDEGHQTASDTERDQNDDREHQDIFQLESDMTEFMDAVDLLRRWPDGDARMGKRLSQITVYAWPSAVRKLRRRFAATINDGASLTLELDRGYLLGPRRGAHVLWRKDSARSAWTT